MQITEQIVSMKISQITSHLKPDIDTTNSYQTMSNIFCLTSFMPSKGKTFFPEIFLACFHLKKANAYSNELKHLCTPIERVVLAFYHVASVTKKNSVFTLKFQDPCGLQQLQSRLFILWSAEVKKCFTLLRRLRFFC